MKKKQKLVFYALYLAFGNIANGNVAKGRRQLLAYRNNFGLTDHDIKTALKRLGL